MDEGWAAVVAAVVAGGVGIGGTLLGTVVGRKQTTDQAHVEHRQWLRGQRQSTYLALLETWDGIVDEMVAMQNSWDGRVQEWQEAAVGPHPGEQADEALHAAGARLRHATEQVDLLGPRSVDEALTELKDAFVGCRDEIRNQSVRQPQWVNREAWEAKLTRATAARRNFHAAAIKTLRTAPGPEQEEEGQ